MRKFWTALAITVVGHAPLAAQTRTLQGDPEAVTAIELMMDRLGGDAVWARARSLYIEYDGWRTQPNEPIIERAWRDFDAPYQRSEYIGQSFHTISVLTPEAGWRYGYTSGNLVYSDAESLEQRQARYPFGFYTVLHAFASGDQRLRLVWESPDTVLVRNTEGPAISRWQIDSTGAPIRWSAELADGREYAYLYGPVQNYGLVNFPAWGIADDGSWRWNYTQIEISPEPPAVSFEPPARALVEELRD